MRLTILGCRGSIPVTDPRMARFGGNTSCCEAEQSGETLYLDAGTGLTNAVPAPGPVHIVLSHCHIDHVLGLPMFSPLTERDREIHLYGRTRNGESIREQIRHLISPPMWPVGMDGYPARVFFHELAFPAQIGAFTLEGMETRHPGGSLALKVTAGGKTVVYATDYTHAEGEDQRLAEFSRGADLLIYDAQYTPEEYAQRPGYGHSTAETGMEVARTCGAKRLLAFHHDPTHTDEMLTAREKALGMRFAREGDIIDL